MNLKENWKNIVVVLSGIVFLITIFNWFNQPKTTLTAKIDVNNIFIPKVVTKQLLDDRVSFYWIDSLLKMTNQNYARELTSTSYDSISQFILKKNHAVFYRKYLNGFNQYCELIITNSGDKEVQDIQVSCSPGTYYEFVDSKGIISSGFTQNKIIIGALQPTEQITINLLSSFYNKDVKITYPDGAINPNEAIKVHGFYASFINFFPNFWLFILLIISIFLFPIIGLFNYIYNRGIKFGRENVDEKSDSKEA